jgi:hypothetical protein
MKIKGFFRKNKLCVLYIVLGGLLSTLIVGELVCTTLNAKATQSVPVRDTLEEVTHKLAPREGYKAYTNPDYGFSFEYPEEFELKAKNPYTNKEDYIRISKNHINLITLNFTELKEETREDTYKKLLEVIVDTEGCNTYGPNTLGICDKVIRVKELNLNASFDFYEIYLNKTYIDSTNPDEPLGPVFVANFHRQVPGLMLAIPYRNTSNITRETLNKYIFDIMRSITF